MNITGTGISYHVYMICLYFQILKYDIDGRHLTYDMLWDTSLQGMPLGQLKYDIDGRPLTYDMLWDTSLQSMPLGQLK